jgi:hypothetical protein
MGTDMKGRRRGRVGALLAAAAAVLAGAGGARGSINFDKTTSTLTLTHDPDIPPGSTDTPLVKYPSIVPPASSLSPPNPYQLEYPQPPRSGWRIRAITF